MPAAQHRNQANQSGWMEIFLRRKWSFLLPFFLILLASLMLANSLPKTYEATALLSIQGLEDFPSDAHTTEPLHIINTRIYQSSFPTDLILSEIEAGYSPATLPGPKQLLANLKISQPSLNQIQITYRDSNPEITREIANRVAETLVQENRPVPVAPQPDPEIGKLKQQSEQALTKFRQSEKAIEDFKGSHREVLLAKVPFKQQIWNAEDNFRKIDAQIAAASREKQIFLDKLAETPKTIKSKRVIERDPKYLIIEKELRELELEQEELLLKYTRKHPQVIRLQERIDLRSKQLNELEDVFRENVEESINPLYQTLQEQLTQKEIEIETLAAQRESALTGLNQLKQKQSQVEEFDQQLQILEQKKAERQEEYNRITTELKNRQSQTRQAKPEPQIYFEIADPAQLPDTPVESHTGMVLLIGLGVGLLVGLGLVFVRQSLDHTLRSVEQATSTLNMPVLGAIPIIMTEEELIQDRAARKRKVIVGVILICILMVFAILYFHTAIDILRNLLGH